MKHTFISGAVLAATTTLSAFLIPALSLAAAVDYEFQVMGNSAKVEAGSIITVQLVNRADGKPVPDAVIFKTRLDMGPDGMEDMTTPVTLLQSLEPGVYRFMANVSMAGNWALSLSAKVQGEAETVTSKLTFRVIK